MDRLKFTKINTDVERQFLIGLIASDSFAKKILPIFEYEYLDLSAAKTISKWCIEYHRKYNRAPQAVIQDIFNDKKKSLKEEDSKWIEEFLVRISEEYSKQGFNEEYLFGSCVKYFKRQKLLKATEKVQELLERNKDDQAQQVWLDSISIPEVDDLGIDPFNFGTVRRLFTRQESRTSLGLGISSLDRMVGPVKSGWLAMCMGPMKRGKCIAEGSLVLLANGLLKPIEKVIEDRDRKILSLSDEGKIVTAKIIDYYDSGKKKVYLVKTKTGREIILPGNDPLLTSDGWKEVAELTKGKYIAVPRKYPFFGKENPPDFKVKLLSYLIAEGTIGNGALSFANKDSIIRKDFETIVVEQMKDRITYSKHDPISCSIVRRKDNRKRKTKSNTAIWLEQINLKRVLSKQKEFPEIVFLLSKEKLSLFLSILFTCDGSIWEDRGRIIIDYSSASKILSYQVLHLLLRFGIIGKVRKCRYKQFRSWEVTISDKENVLKFMKEIGFAFYKKDRAEKYFPLIQNKKDGRGFLDIIPFTFSKWIKQEVDLFAKKNGGMTRAWWKQTPLQSLDQSLRHGYNLTRITLERISEIIGDPIYLKQLRKTEILWDKIVSITSIGRKRTFDLSIKDNYNFVANDIFVHNTFFLIHMAVRGLLRGYGVVFISLETEEIDNAERIWMNIGSLTKEKEGLMFPYFAEEDGVRYRKVQRPELGEKQVIEEIRTFQKAVNPRFRIKTFPMGSGGMKDVRQYLDMLEAYENFSPHVIIVDYLGLLKAPPGSQGRDVYNENSKALKALAHDRKAIVFSGHQGTRETLEKINMSPMDMPEDIRIFANVDALYGLLQTDKEMDEE